MAKHTWQTNELITADRLNDLEDRVEDSNKIIEVAGQYNTLNLDDPHEKLLNGYRSLVFFDTDERFTSFFPVKVGTNISASLVMSSVAYTNEDNVSSGGATWGFQFYSNSAFISSIYSGKSKNSESHADKIENIVVPTGATKARLRFRPDYGILKINIPMVNVGSQLLPFENTPNNLLTNPTFSDGLLGYTSSNDGTLPLNKNTDAIETEKNTAFYRIETSKNLSGTLPEGILGNSLNGALIKIQGSTENGTGGTTITMFTKDKSYQKTYTYEWSNWNVLQGVYGSFDEAGVWHTLNGNVLKAGIAYNNDDGYFYALAADGKVYTQTGWQTLPVGLERTNLTIKLLGDGKIDPDISSSPTATAYVDTVNEFINNSSPKTSIHVIVSDTHGVDYNNYSKSVNYLLTGQQFKSSLYDDILPISEYVKTQDYENLTSQYYKAISKLNAVNAPKIINNIVTKYSKTPTVFSHLGDMEDGHNSTALEEKKSYDIVASPYTEYGYNIVDGNHDEQPYPYEQYPLLNSAGATVGRPIPGYVRTRRIDTQRWKESYKKDLSYYSVLDSTNKINYIYLDTFEGGKLKLKSGGTPDYGEYKKGAKLTSDQVDWLISSLLSTPDDYAVVINTHIIPYENLFGKQPTSSDGTWWQGNVNPDILSGVLKAFQNSSNYVGSSSFTNDMDNYDMSAYTVSVNVDFSGKPKNRIAVINYGHHHRYGHTNHSDNGSFNLVQCPNLLGLNWSYIGDVRGQQFTTELIDTTNRTVTVIRFSPTDTSDENFTMSY